MAYSSTNENYYATKIKDFYSNTISGQISRIEDAHVAIRAKVAELGLKIKKGDKLTSNENGTSDLILTENHHILDTASAINNIPINNDVDKTINAGDQYVVPVGYNKNTYIITAQNLGNQTDGNAESLDILYGKTAWVNGSKVIGSMLDNSGNQETSNYGSYSSDSKNYLYLSIPKTGKYTAGSQLQSTIPYHAPGDIELPVTIKTTVNGEILAESTQVIPAGYYPNSFTIKAVHEKTGDDDTPKVINISNTLPQLTSQTGNLIIQSGYDYFSKNASYSIKSGSITAVTTSVSDEGLVTFGGGVTTAGWISSNVVKPQNYTLDAAEFSKDNITGKVTVTAAGWITKDTVVGDALNKATVSLSNVKKATSNISIGGTTINTNQHYVEYTTTQGYLVGNETGAINLGTVSISSATSSATSGQTEITTQKWKVTTTKGYNPNTVTTELKVQAGTISPNVKITTTSSGQTKTYTCTLNVTKSGWVDAKSITLDINAIEDTYQLSESDLNGTGIKVYADDSSLMKSLEVDMGIIVQRLSAI